MKSAVVTGASTGIGRGCVKILAQNGFHVFGSVRKETDANRLSQEFGAAFTPLLFDITDEAAVARAAESVKKALGGETLSGLVNNAGVAVPGPLLHLSPDEFRQQIAVNLTGQLIVTQAFAPLLMAANGKTAGRIVMMSSVGGKNAMPFLGPYNASKFGLEGMSEALRRELLLLGIKVVVIRPGAVATPIWDKADLVDTARFDNTPYRAALEKIKTVMIAEGRKGYPPERIGEAVLTALTAARPKTAYTVNPAKVQGFILNTLPKPWADRLIAGQLGLLPPRHKERR